MTNYDEELELMCKMHHFMLLLLEPCQEHSVKSTSGNSSLKTTACTLAAIYKDVKSSWHTHYTNLFAQGCLVAIKDLAWHS